MKKSVDDESVDLSDLVVRARESVELDEARRATHVTHVNVLNRLMPILIVVTLLASSVWAINSMWHHVAPHTQERILRDLDTIIEQARDSIESNRRSTGRLPERLPNAALASVVFYDYSGDAYRLFVVSGDLSVMLDNDGNKTINKGR